MQSTTAHLEALEYTSFFEQKRRELEERIMAVKSDALRRRLSNSGYLNRLVAKQWEDYCRESILKKVQLRKQFGRIDHVLLADDALDSLLADILHTIEICNVARKEDFEREGRAAGAVTAISENVIDVDGLAAMARREIKKVKLEREIEIMNEVPRQQGTITINVSNSTIAALNLNSVIQEVTATVNSLHATGNDQIASALKALTEAVTVDESLGPDRRDILEAVNGLGEQANLPAESRKLGIVKSLFGTLRDFLAVGSSTASIWHQWGPQIQQFFGF